jgi:RHS repeat-associated protein
LSHPDLQARQVADLERYIGRKVSHRAHRPLPDTLRRTGAGLFFFHPDHLGSGALLTDVNGDSYQFFVNLPFGETLAEQKASGTYNNVYKFTGKELDAETGLYYHGARYYDPGSSIWLSVDPLAGGFPSWGPYVYTLNNPVRLTDPTGMAPEGEAEPDDRWRGVWNNETQKYDYTWVSDEGGDEYDIIEHYSANMASKDSYRRETRIDNPYYGDDRYASSREGMGKWRGIATGKAATMDGADDPIFRGILAIMTRGASEGIGSLEMGGVSKVLGLAKGGAKGNNWVTSLVKKDDRLLKLARETFEGNDLLRKEANNLIEQLGKGNVNPGIGTKNIGGNIFEARSRGGARVYFRNSANGGVELLGYSNKTNQQQVIDRILKIY